MADVQLRQPADVVVLAPVRLHQEQPQQGYDRAALESAELAAFEKGRMQGEMEAIRRAEAEAPLKTMAAAPVDLAAQQALANTPDIIEINRLTWIQKIAAGLGEACITATVVLTIVWLLMYRDNVAWQQDMNNGDQQMYNAGLLSFAIGLFFHSQAISNYRILPLNMSAHLNRAWYITMTIFAVTCYIVTLAAVIMTNPAGEANFWRIDNWCLILALAIYLPHAFYSMARAVMERVWPVKYETWAEVNNKLDYHTHHLAGRHGAAKDAAHANGLAIDERRTVYTPAPHSFAPNTRNIPAANANVGAQVPVAPANAPRWAETPRTHAEDYFLLARAKWANVAYWAMGAVFLMFLASTEALQAAGRGTWAQGALAGPSGEFNQDGDEAHLIGALGVITLGAIIFISYASMPPRTTLVKNGGIVDARRPSISAAHADTRLGHSMV